MINKLNTALKWAIVPAFLLTSASAQAGGLFGEGGIFRGDLGRALDPIEKNFTTPVARGAAVAGGAIVGGVVGGAFGAPHTGAMVGQYVGQEFNNRLAGRSNPVGRPAYYGRSPNYYPQPSYTYDGYNSYPQPQYYNAPRYDNYGYRGYYAPQPRGYYNYGTQYPVYRVMNRGYSPYYYGY